ncbi:hypothetical protein HELRODRAFT_159211 [Helobdella robusta]|uniref:Uncharacterized protein n=1 Tax=Helobdella robusta TaxID=6412 RepID=T1ENR1_HELRO|nr:hypothetical protein HELRODRAFT_159211 [Helobdella robusta]ESO12637.1 hypothetical protein HELRODRAFT_159211 [Helobdella robusta]
MEKNFNQLKDTVFVIPAKNDQYINIKLLKFSHFVKTCHCPQMHEILFIAKKYSLQSPDLILIFLQIRLKNPEVIRSMGPRTSIQIGKNSIEGRAPSYFLIFSSDALRECHEAPDLTSKCSWLLLIPVPFIYSYHFNH